MNLCSIARAALGVALVSAVLLSNVSAQKNRGAVISQGASAQDLQRLAQLDANLVRWQINDWNGTNTSAAVSQLRALIRSCPPAMHIVVDLHGAPAGQFDSVSGRGQFVAFWRSMAFEFRGNSAIWGFDLLNEPHMSHSRWRDLCIRAGDAIRQQDATRRIIVQSMDGTPSTIRYLTPLPARLEPVMYSVHFWHPMMAYNHQGIDGRSPRAYPGLARIRTGLQPVVDWIAANNRKVFIGEFGVSRRALDGDRYLRDLINEFERHNMPWCLHAWRESYWWDLERLPSTRPASSPRRITTPQLDLVASYWRRS